MPGKLVVLNGGSSAGKTSLAHALQDQFEEPYLLLGIDAFWFSIPPRQLDLDRVEPRYYTWRVYEENGKEYFEIVPGPILDQVMAGRYRAIRAYLDLGLNVIADEVLWKCQWLEDALRLLDGYEVYLIGVEVSDSEGARREHDRGDRHEGWNRGSARAAHRNCGRYDLEVDTTSLSPAAAANKIKDMLESGTPPTAFAALRRKLSEPEA